MGMVLTGHSLGGALVEVVAAHLGMDALVFSAPGTRYLENVFAMGQQPSQKYVNICPEHDLVPRVDDHFGVVQKILCRNKIGNTSSSPYCHGLIKTGCELW